MSGQGVSQGGIDKDIGNKGLSLRRLWRRGVFREQRAEEKMRRFGYWAVEAGKLAVSKEERY